jgi:hypothetical protein
LQAEGLRLSVTVIHQILREEGFTKLPRRRQGERERQVRPERAAPTTIEAVDWNCSQHITPRYTKAEIESLIAPLLDEIQALKAQISSA